MRRLITFCIIILSALLAKKATAQNGSGAALNIALHEVQTIEIDGSDKAVNLEYKTKEDYSKGVSLSKENHLKVYSTGGFDIRVRTSDPALQSTSNSLSIGAGDIVITATKGSANGMETFSTSPVHLSGTDTAFISSTKGANSKTFDVSYAAAGDNKYLNLYSKQQKPTVYTTEVVYSIFPH